MVKRKTRKTSRSRPSTKPLPGWVWMITGLAIGLSATFLPSLNNDDDQTTHAIKESNEKEAPAKRKFDFYTLLPELEVVVDKDSHKSTNAPSKSLPAGEYVLQVGSFKSNEEADSLKAQLALIGVETNIEIVKVNAVSWHRVRVGPNKDVSQLQSIQQRLRSKNMDSILLKVRS